MKCVFVDLNAGHSCSAEYEEEESSHYQQKRRTSTERLKEDSHSEAVTTENIKATSLSSKNQLSPTKSARITSCGKFDPQKLLVMKIFWCFKICEFLLGYVLIMYVIPVYFLLPCCDALPNAL